MAPTQMLSFQAYFEVVEDPQVCGRCDHPLDSLLFLIVSAVIAGADGPSDIEEFGEEKQERLEQFVELPNGIPSHDTIGRILATIKPSAFQQALMDWGTQLRQDAESEDPIVILIDGKTVRCQGQPSEAPRCNPTRI